ncbi:hypothetical protein O6H91_21G051600 [Diphasiastrum complanatum]|uniref:Uncharacterized protein n=1 Tax=Diphasiastrum complanatum TaxID=34168 RepID=A0ACC2AKM7_DIPCM|nr:hypothetical protein O6H91_21G051600 [Diphasiastrum complanatum]
MLQKEELKKDLLHQYRYYIISGQHSIMAAKKLVLSLQCPNYLKQYYGKRLSRILCCLDTVELVKLSSKLNELQRNVMKRSPYQETLQQARKQWEEYGSPTKPLGGHSMQDENWKVVKPSRRIEDDIIIILDLDDILMKRCDTGPQCSRDRKWQSKQIKLRHGWLEFLKNFLSKFKIDIWSSMDYETVLSICSFMEREACQKLPFFMLWSLENCYQHSSIMCPKKPFVAANFKPLCYI